MSDNQQPYVPAPEGQPQNTQSNATPNTAYTGQPQNGYPGYEGYAAPQQAAYGQPAAGQPAYGEPVNGQNAYGQPAAGGYQQPQYGAQPTNPYVQPQQPPYGPAGAYAQPQYGQPQYNQPQYGPQYGQPVNPYTQPYSAPQYPAGYAAKSKMAAGLLGIFLGSLGVHNFYLGYTGKAVCQLLLTLVGWIIIGLGPIAAAIWGLVEGILILSSQYGSPWHKDANGQELTD
ncbi:TM2 domain-containing protein [Bifidobacterium olomucense]|uniref:TM2 domain-containing protein n=1 Tax=Bifidobacterium olomucense TaxID=2675324 RepID=A0A7Y0HXI7_9BIFI|nr:TM2 domain-containing protein [Bifidobacterium sp. DSM 109959]NMM98342.1 TM2 domain-containing protein [Bifidobacterium sp. DSM 109959]